jgi:hypothetical protein
MLLRCVKTPPASGLQVDDDTKSPLYPLTKDKLYRPLGLVRVPLDHHGAANVYALVRSDLAVFDDSVPYLFSFEHFEVIDHKIDYDWYFYINPNSSWYIGNPIGRDLEALHKSLAAGDQSVIDELLRSTAP